MFYLALFDAVQFEIHTDNVREYISKRLKKNER